MGSSSGDNIAAMAGFRICGLALIMFVITLGQLPAAEQDEHSESLALARYDVLLREVHWYQAKADEVKGQGKPDAFLRQFHQDRLELTTERSDQLVQLAHRYTQDIHVIDRKARVLISSSQIEISSLRQQCTAEGSSSTTGTERFAE